MNEYTSFSAKKRLLRVMFDWQIRVSAAPSGSCRNHTDRFVSSRVRACDEQEIPYSQLTIHMGEQERNKFVPELFHNRLLM
eukprot:1877302-Amphidinium_carterae.1